MNRHPIPCMEQNAFTVPSLGIQRNLVVLESALP